MDDDKIGRVTTPDLFDGIITRRVMAAIMDYLILLAILGAICIAAIMSAIVTLGLLVVPAFLISFPIIDIFYCTLTIGGTSQATWGQRIFGVKAVDEEGKAPGYLRAFIYSALYYAIIVPTTFLLELIAFFNDRRRTLPDILSGIVFIRG